MFTFINTKIITFKKVTFPYIVNVKSIKNKYNTRAN